jgi:hypothetical protein
MRDADDGAARLRPYMQQYDWSGPDEYLDDGYGDGQYDPDPPMMVGDVDASFVRPYQLTGGRTVPVDPTLALEAQVVADLAILSQPGMLRYEHREVVTLAQDPVSLAELGALLHLHLQVVRVLVADLAAAGHLRVLRPTRASATDPAMIERVIRGLSAIS